MAYFTFDNVATWPRSYLASCQHPGFIWLASSPPCFNPFPNWVSRSQMMSRGLRPCFTQAMVWLSPWMPFIICAAFYWCVALVLAVFNNDTSKFTVGEWGLEISLLYQNSNNYLMVQCLPLCNYIILVRTMEELNMKWGLFHMCMP